MLCLTALLAAGSAAARAQGGHGGGNGGGMGMPGGGRGMGMPGGGGGMGRGDRPVPHDSGVPRSTPAPGGSGNAPVSSNRGGLQLGPPGRWWDDKKFAKSLGLNSDQQKRMDDVFGQHREALVARYQNRQSAESDLEKLTRSDHPDQAALFTEIDRVAQARAELEKANTRMLLQIRGEMTPEQIDRLEEHR